MYPTEMCTIVHKYTWTWQYTPNWKEFYIPAGDCGKGDNESALYAASQMNITNKTRRKRTKSGKLEFYFLEIHT